MTAVLGTAILQGLAAPANAAVPPPGQPGGKLTAVVSLGDSYISGEGGRLAGDPYDCGVPSCSFAANEKYADKTSAVGDPGAWYPGTWNYTDISGTHAGGCHRSLSAEINGVVGVDKHINIACSGAASINIVSNRNNGLYFKGENPQADQLWPLATTYDIKAVVLSVGGNDLGFADIIADCVKDFTFSWTACHDYQDRQTSDKLATVMNGIGRAVDDIRAVMRGANYADGAYKIIIQDYPIPVADGAHITSDRTKRGCPLYSTDADWVNSKLIPRLQGAVRKVAHDKGAQFLDLSQAFRGHELCNQSALPVNGGPVAMKDAEWTNKLLGSADWNKMSESLHPNFYGQTALQKCLNLMFASTGDQQCVNQPGFNGTDGITLSPWSDHAPNQSNTLAPGESLYNGQCKNSANHKANLCLMYNGALLIYDENGVVRWTAPGTHPDQARMGDDGNFYAVAGSSPTWMTGTWGNPGSWVAVQEDGNVVVYNSVNTPLWASNTGH